MTWIIIGALLVGFIIGVALGRVLGIWECRELWTPYLPKLTASDYPEDWGPSDDRDEWR